MNEIARIRDDLLQARKNHEQLTVQALQSLLARIANAEAVPADSIAGDTVGVGATEAPRKLLSAEDVQAVIRLEIDELHEAHDRMSVYPDHHYTRDLAQKIAIVSRYVTSG